MSIVLLLIACSLGVAALFAAAFLWSVHTGQFDDLDANSVRILYNPSEKNNDTNVTNPE